MKFGDVAVTISKNGGIWSRLRFKFYKNDEIR
jgi:hypothetical protein